MYARWGGQRERSPTGDGSTALSTDLRRASGANPRAGILSDVRSPLEVCLSVGGVARAAELRQAGCSRRAVSSALARGEIARVRYGVFVHPVVTLDERHALAHGGRLGCVSVAAALGLWTLPFTGTHISVPSDFHTFDHPDCTGVDVHWSVDRAFGDYRRRQPLGDAIRDIGHCQGLEGALVVIESGLHPSKRSIVPADLVLLRELWPEGRTVIDFVGDKSDSGLESLVRWRLHKLGIPSVPQFRVEGVGRVDLLVGDRLIIELDGGTHSDALGVSRDRRRDAISTAAGYRTERYGYQQVIYDWPQVLDAIMAIIRRGEHLHSAARRAYL